jgi:hypothetical protein
MLLAAEADGRPVGDVQGRSIETAMPPGVRKNGLLMRNL